MLPVEQMCGARGCTRGGEGFWGKKKSTGRRAAGQKGEEGASGAGWQGPQGAARAGDLCGSDCRGNQGAGYRRRRVNPALIERFARRGTDRPPDCRAPAAAVVVQTVAEALEHRAVVERRGWMANPPPGTRLGGNCSPRDQEGEECASGKASSSSHRCRCSGQWSLCGGGKSGSSKQPTDTEIASLSASALMKTTVPHSTQKC